ncbi:GNAT family N-acetyltransferase [uncultured Jatrophihabitans sp.]|uniref:GNAT family N-acetyltransferase n=1 Tax=uncultured Jatrophihabitans sp. TaxID=1610747 RepID=UPI0035CC9B74
MPLELVHPVDTEDLEGWSRQLMMTLMGDVHGEEFTDGVERRRWVLEPARTWGARERGHWVGTLATFGRTITVPGPDGTAVELAADALTGVSVAATHRRRGLLTTMITQSLQAAADRGDALSMLVAAEWPIYGRFGYAPAVDAAGYTFRPRRSGGVAGADTHCIRPVDLDEARALAPAIFDSARRRRAGQVQRLPRWWDQQFGREGAAPLPSMRASWFVHDGPDGPDGMLAWRRNRDFDLYGPLAAVDLHEFFAAGPEAYRDQWGYLAAMDVVEEINIHQAALDEQVRFLLADGRALETTSTFDFVWLRMLDVPAALSARTYGVSDSIVLDVVDTAGPGYAQGRYVLVSDDTGSHCTRTDVPADLRLDQRDLASIYLGGHRLREVAVAGRVEELTPGSLDRASAMFATALLPVNQTGF